MVGLWAVDRARLVGSGDGVVDSTGEERVHPAGMKGLKSHRVVALAGQLGQPLDEAERTIEVSAMAVVDREAELGLELLGGGALAIISSMARE